MYSYLYERHEYEEAKKLQVKAESQDAQAAFKAVLAHLQQVSSQQEPAENTPLGFQTALLQADPEEKEDDPELKAIKLKSLFKLLLNYKSYFKVGDDKQSVNSSLFFVLFRVFLFCFCFLLFLLLLLEFFFFSFFFVLFRFAYEPSFASVSERVCWYTYCGCFERGSKRFLAVTEADNN